MRFTLLFCLAFFAFCDAFASPIFDKIPDEIDPNAKYIFYSHGYIVEGEDPTPVHPGWGMYDYPAILEKLTGFGAVVISEHRKAKSSPTTHAEKLKNQVSTLLEMGVPQRNITLIGFSRGGYITALASNAIQKTDINYVLLAACTTSMSRDEDIVLTGHVLSIHESSDSVGSCDEVIKRNPKAVSSFKEIEIFTGLEHGAFYRPTEAWISPIKSWLETHVSSVPYSPQRSSIIQLEESATGRIYPTYVQLPRSYSTSPSKHYPVIYTTDAPYSFPTLVGATRNPMYSGVMEEAIIVSVSYSTDSRGIQSRVRDYTPIKSDSWKMETGNADSHIEFLKSDIFPFIESKYRTDANSRIFIGHSLGGLFGAYILFKSPDIFSSYILASPSVWFNDNYLLKLAPQKTPANTKVYLSVGFLETPEFGEREDMVQGSNMLAEKISKQSDGNVQMKFVVVDGASHATVFPTIAIQGLDWILGKGKRQ